MTGVALGSVLLAAVVVGWPVSVRRARLRRVLAFGAVAAGSGGLTVGAAGSGGLTARCREWLGRWQRPAVQWLRRPGAADHPWRGPQARPLPAAASPGAGPTGRRVSRRLPSALLQAGLLAGVVAILAALTGGPVAAVVVGTYTFVAVLSWQRRRRRRAGAVHRARLLDLLGGAAADLRAGLPAATAFADLQAVGGDDPLWAQARAAARLAERTGAPLAAVIERVEADARSADRAAAAAGAQVAGARATAVMLAGLPLAGLGLGYAIGAEPLPVLLHTPVGAAAAVSAVGLQLAGLGWAARITRPAGAPR